MPAMYWPSAMPSRPDGLFATASRRWSEMRRIASRCIMSVIGHAAFVM